MKKINLYVFIQIFKSCTLVFFIFIAISWLLQISRLFSFLSNFQIEFLDIFYLSIFLIPNLINVIMPFIIIFGFIIAFIKFDKDKEIIAMFSLGMSINEVKKPIIYFSTLIITFYIILNFFLSPFVYDIYKKKEFNLRNLIDLNNVNISNFIELDKNLVLDFTKQNGKFEDVFLKYKIENENIIYAKEATIKKNDNELIFNLLNGFKIEFINDKIQKLEFKSYKFNFPLNKKNIYDNIDKNSLTIFDLIKNKKYIIILEKIFESFLIITLIILFYTNNIKTNNFNLKKIFTYLILSILFLIFQNIIKNIEIDNKNLIILNILNISLVYFYIITKNLKLK